MYSSTESTKTSHYYSKFNIYWTVRFTVTHLEDCVTWMFSVFNTVQMHRKYSYESALSKGSWSTLSVCLCALAGISTCVYCWMCPVLNHQNKSSSFSKTFDLGQQLINSHILCAYVCSSCSWSVKIYMTLLYSKIHTFFSQ